MTRLLGHIVRKPYFLPRLPDNYGDINMLRCLKQGCGSGSGRIMAFGRIRIWKIVGSGSWTGLNIPVQNSSRIILESNFSVGIYCPKKYSSKGYINYILTFRIKENSPNFVRMMVMFRGSDRDPVISQESNLDPIPLESW